MSENASTHRLPEQAIKLLARIIARAYLADTQAKDTAVAKPLRKVKKDENVYRAKRSNADGKGSHQSKR